MKNLVVTTEMWTNTISLCGCDIIEELAEYADVDDKYDDDEKYEQYRISDLLITLHAVEALSRFEISTDNAFLIVYHRRALDINRCRMLTTLSEIDVRMAANAMLQYAIDHYADRFAWSDDYDAYINPYFHDDINQYYDDSYYEILPIE